MAQSVPWWAVSLFALQSRQQAGSLQGTIPNEKTVEWRNDLCVVRSCREKDDAENLSARNSTHIAINNGRMEERLNFGRG